MYIYTHTYTYTYTYTLTQTETPPCEQIVTTSTRDPIKSFPLTAQCPEGVSPELTQNRLYCEEPSLIENALDRFSLVFKNSISTLSPALAFKNQYCANCNGVFVNDSLVDVYQPEFGCGNESSQAEQLLREEGYDLFEQFLMQNCTPIYNSVTYYHLMCLVIPIPYIDSCNKSMANVLHNYDELQVACKAYKTYVISNETDPFHSVVYKNPHCAVCNGHDLSTLVCFNIDHFNEWMKGDQSKAGTVGFPSFTLLVDFEGSRKAVVYDGFEICPAESYLDIDKDTCIQNKCPRGQVMLQGNCSGLQLNSVLPVDMRETYSIIFQIRNITGAKDMAVGFFTYVFEVLEGSPPRVLNASLDTECVLLQSLEDIHGTQNRTDTSRPGDSFSYLCVVIELLRESALDLSTLKTIESVVHIASFSVVLSRETRSHLFEFLTQNGYNYRSIRLLSVHLLNHHPGQQLWNGCQEHSWITSQRETVSLTEKNTGPGGAPPSLAIYWSAFDLTLSLEEFPALLSWTKPSLWQPVTSWPVAILSSNCLPHLFTCELVMLHVSNIVVEDAHRIRVKGHMQLINPDQYARADNGVFICRDVLKNATLVSSSPASKIEGWLTLCGISLSLLGLFLTLITYCIFPVLRTRPGLAIMNLCFALFVAQLLFEVSPVVADNGNLETLCIVVGTLQHYSWLVAFCWMNVLALDTAVTFSSKIFDSQQKASSSKFRVYLLYAWGLPVLIVGLCVCFDLLKLRSFAYIDLDLCWLKSGQTLLMGFGLPLAVLVFLNVIFFVKTAVSLRRTMSQAKMATSDLPDRSSCIIYMKLFFIMGLSWILGFISAVTDAQWVAYGFIVINSLQGAFICLSFGLTSRVCKMYRAKWTWLHKKADHDSAIT